MHVESEVSRTLTKNGPGNALNFCKIVLRDPMLTSPYCPIGNVGFKCDDWAVSNVIGYTIWLHLSRHLFIVDDTEEIS